MKRVTPAARLLSLALLASPLAGRLLADPPPQVARISYVSGAVSFRPAVVDDWAPAEANRPVGEGDGLWMDDGSRAELETARAVLRVDQRTNVDFLNLGAAGVQVRLPRGTVQVRLRALLPSETFEISTPAGAVTLKRPGRYRVDVSDSGTDTTVVVRKGEASVTSSGAEFGVLEGEKALVVEGQPPVYDIAGAEAQDAFDDWCLDRDRRAERAVKASAHVSRETIGAEELETSGSWVEAGDLGVVWQPPVTAGWVPYRFGRWVWDEPWGWTWIDDAAWGFAPFHYGRWAFWSSAWVWVPGPIVVRPVYLPHTVGFFGPGPWTGGVAGVVAPVGWFPLGPRDPWVPGWHASVEWVTRANPGLDVTVAGTFPNRAAGGATVVAGDVFTGARPVGGAAVAVPASAAAAPVAGTAPAVAPRRESLAAPSPSGAKTARPPDAISRRVVQARLQPAPRAVPFSARTAALAAAPGRPLEAAKLAELRGAAGRGDVRPAGDGAGELRPKREGLRSAQRVERGGFVAAKSPAASAAAPANGKRAAAAKAGGKKHAARKAAAGEAAPKPHKPKR